MEIFSTENEIEFWRQQIAEHQTFIYLKRCALRKRSKKVRGNFKPLKS